MQKLYLIRHGQSEANRLRIVAGQHETPLSELGEQQAAAAGKALKTIGIDLIVSSPQIRARQTAEIIALQLGMNPTSIVKIDELKERNLGDLEGKSYALNPASNGNVEDVEGVPNVEPLPDLFARAQKALSIIRQQPEQRILVVCHNGLGRMLQVVVAGKLPHDLYAQPRLENGHPYELT